ncbi:hypothetical protein M8H41_09610 [Desulfosporosinus nitroreducens]|uniref:DUF4025 domain-containing protein n=1 Tax=Desulfosporosinus nitroreducens TaxID=2018668 RepID=A0ABT8QP39_9FIRM|nr:hypothetical protein [Desulfosporosinus nitroreducens]MDO0823108.1 hypothetical protein [Desulfosporosinus nitroreducens]
MQTASSTLRTEKSQAVSTYDQSQQPKSDPQSGCADGFQKTVETDIPQNGDLKDIVDD